MSSNVLFLLADTRASLQGIGDSIQLANQRRSPSMAQHYPSCPKLAESVLALPIHERCVSKRFYGIILSTGDHKDLQQTSNQHLLSGDPYGIGLWFKCD